MVHLLRRLYGVDAPAVMPVNTATSFVVVYPFFANAADANLSSVAPVDKRSRRSEKAPSHFTD